ncbi:uncharacterized protein LOC119305973 [Triticum dicoccoides]|uniref:uncharacterized protein LOC119305973 n=1 Tax=Triticum dicoccoides TaxID=85692 RepID=UPI00188E3EA0|nr:uncharacterized protein LOC119305973 [Triticum dicoccoides]
MDCEAITPRGELERILFDESAEPKALPLSLLEHITSGFSDDKEIGCGGFARVYKGMLDNGMVAVKKLFETVDIDEKKFSEEVHCLMKAKHKNIVRCLGYCSDTQGEMVRCEGKLVLADVRQRLLCFEYLPKGSLDKQITDASCGLEWKKRFQIINGICNGLYYLHQNQIVHLDLKPENILLDDNMLPKIADFGLSRCFDENQSRAITSNMFGTIGYLAPEFYARRQITFKLDIYSLGMIIIEMLTGEKGYADIDNVLERWRNRLYKSDGDAQLIQVRVCTEIAIECTDFNPTKRPDIQHIMHRLGSTKNVDKFATGTGTSTSSSIPMLAASSPDLKNTMANEVKQSTEKQLHTFDLLANCSILDESTLSFLKFASLPHFVVHASSDCSSNISLLQHANPDELTIDRLENVKSAEEAQNIKLVEKQKIKELTFQWTVAAGRFVDDKEVLEKLVAPSSVQRLFITGYRSVNFPNWLMGIRHYLHNILEINLWNFPNCNKLPPLGQLPNLEYLNLNRMEGLEEWNTMHYSGKEGLNELMFPKLQRLRIEQCDKLRIKPCLPRAMYLHISGCDTMLSSWAESASHSGTSSSSPITELNVVGSKVSMHKWRMLHLLPALRRLIITDCSDLTTSPQITHNLSSLRELYLELLSQAALPRWLLELTTLQELTLSGCASMTIPEWFGGLTSLKQLKIEDCKGIRTLPESIQQLTKLEHLSILGCPTLVKWCESKENRRKLVHIRAVFPM